MNFFDVLKSSLKNIAQNKMRSFLTMLGIIIGISSVIMIVSLGRGSTEQISSQFEKMGAKTLNVSVDTENSVKSDLLTINDVKAIEDSDQDIISVSPQDQMTGSVQIQDNKKPVLIYFVNQNFPDIGGLDMLYGRFFNQKEYEDLKPYIVLDSLTCEKLFKTSDVVNKDVRVNVGGTAKVLNIIGVFDIAPYYAGIGTNMAESTGVPGFAFIPFSIKQDLGLYNKNSSIISAILKTTEREKQVADSIIKTLSIKHNNLGKNLYIIEKGNKQMSSLTSILDIVTLLVIAVATISLIVGGIGVMNIMLVSVTERTREIGTRKALGATTYDIMMQFLIEAVTMCLLGGIIGIVFGLTVAYVVANFIGLKSSPTVSIILIALGFSSMIGMFFGIYPAKKAADLNPIDSLRFE